MSISSLPAVPPGSNCRCGVHYVGSIEGARSRAKSAASKCGLHLRFANAFQSALAQWIRIALAGFRKLDDLVCYRLLDVVVAVSGPQADADLFERDTKDAHSFLIELFAVQKKPDWHRPHPARDRSLSHPMPASGLWSVMAEP